MTPETQLTAGLFRILLFLFFFLSPSPWKPIFTILSFPAWFKATVQLFFFPFFLKFFNILWQDGIRLERSYGKCEVSKVRYLGESHLLLPSYFHMPILSNISNIHAILSSCKTLFSWKLDISCDCFHLRWKVHNQTLCFWEVYSNGKEQKNQTKEIFWE